MTRLPPLPADQWDDRVTGALAVLLAPERLNPSGAGNVLSTLVRHPALTEAYLHLNGHLLVRSTLPARLREIAILRIVARRDCGYLFDHHVPIAQRVGLPADDIAGVSSGALPDELDNVVVCAVDELDERTELSDQTWATLGRHLDEQQRLDLIFTVGCYLMLAMTVKTLQIDRDD